MVVAMSVAPAVDVGDVGELYGSLSRRLEQIVRRDVRGADAVIEDACQIAWFRLVVHASRVSSDTVLSWLATTAVHEALKLLRRAGRELSLDEAPGATASCPPPDPYELVEYRDRLRTIARLPQRQRQMLWLQGAGLSYNEIAVATNCTPRTVERQLLRAKRSLREGQVP
jgi:RNA polymerase sigma factor (sigma-70 family)